MPSANARGSRAKYWCFTHNNYTEETIALYSDIERNSKIAYISFAKEVGEQGTPHLQGHVELNVRCTLNQVRRMFLGAHVEVRKGTFEEAQNYIEKETDPVAFGERESVGSGKRTDLDTLQIDLQNGRTMREITDDHFSSVLRYSRGINVARNVYARQRDWKCSVIVYWGSTGTGKTRAVYDNLSSRDDVYVHPGGGWFDGYDGQPVALFDDFGGSEFKLSYLLKLLDRYPMRVPIKGGFVAWAPREIYITSNINPDLWFANANPEHVRALMRRITHKVYFN